MRRSTYLIGLCLVMGMGPLGCQSDVAPGVARVPGPDERRMTGAAQTAKPLPPQEQGDLPPPPFDDVPLVSQEAPETSRFLDAYEKVGHPRILVWVSRGPREYYDEAAARGIDYAAMENILTDWLSAGGRVAVIAPEAARQVLSAQQVQDLNDTRPANTQEVGDKLRADVLVLIRAEPTRQAGGAPAVRIVADASNIKGAESIGRAVVDVPPPLDKPQINKYTRFVARKLMSDMTGSWTSFGSRENSPANPPGDGTAPAPATQPAGVNPYLNK